MTDNELIAHFESIIQTKAGYVWQDVLDLLKRQQAENERLQDIASPKCQQCVSRTIESAKSEAIKEFAERLKEKRLLYDSTEAVSIERIDNLVKEMTEQ